MLNNTDCIQIAFKPAVETVGDGVISHFGARLAAIYLTGSVAGGDALPGVSDLDWFMFLDDTPSEDDLAWCRALQERMQKAFPIVAEFHLTPHPVAKLEEDAFWRFAVRYNAIRLYGRDLPAELEARGIVIDAPSREGALRRLPWIQRVYDDVRGGAIPSYLYPAPAEPHLAMRKLARYFVITEGAYLLMARPLHHVPRPRRAARAAPRLPAVGAALRHDRPPPAGPVHRAVHV